ncbi:glucose-6-phosphate dehydrogenase assembly protein OpcA [Georgenia subflava]|uniref:OpcA protein n=1 Tax=Georgenia subflava TaxID=1622177 RepID=A0A6N7ERU7_9MICO|nr:glucose-6-phosphate dehydrogenase assembly protein OpcA [Georgenia subflava]MPV37904.1 OpcA protein [Georgenia subflava]
MIVTMRSTTSADVGARMVSLRDEGGAVALGRVLTLIIRPDDDATAERAIRTANGASHEHPMRVIVVLPDDDAAPAGLDAEIRVGGDAGASEVVVLRPRGGAGANPDTLVTPLLLPDAPTVAWWPSQPPASPSEDPIGAMAQRRITEAIRCEDPVATLHVLADGYAAGDTDLAWGGLTLWRGMLAAALDEPPQEPVLSAQVSGSAEHPSVDLLAAWLRVSLGVPATVVNEGHDAISKVVLERASGPVSITRPEGSTVAVLSRPGRPDQRLNLPKRSTENTLIEELRRLDPDVTYGRVLTKGLRELSQA